MCITFRRLSRPPLTIFEQIVATNSAKRPVTEPGPKRKRTRTVAAGKPTFQANSGIGSNPPFSGGTASNPPLSGGTASNPPPSGGTASNPPFSGGAAFNPLPSGGGTFNSNTTIAYNRQWKILIYRYLLGRAKDGERLMPITFPCPYFNLIYKPLVKGNYPMGLPPESLDLASFKDSGVTRELVRTVLC